jgi:hypothetical protein
MRDNLRLDLTEVPDDQLEVGASVFGIASETWAPVDGAAGISAYFANLSRSFREEMACREAGVPDGVRLVDCELVADSDEMLALALLKMERVWSAEAEESPLRGFIAKVAIPVHREMQVRQVPATSTDTIPPESFN